MRINKQKRFASYRVTLLYVKLKFYYKTHDLKQNWFHTESSFSNQMFLSLNFVWYSNRWLSAESQFSWSSEQNHSKITSHEFAYSKLKDESLKWFICNPCLCFGWLFSLLYFSISDKDELARHFCKSLWQYFLNIIRLIALKMHWLLYIHKQNIYGNWRGLRSLTINQQLDKKAFAWITALFYNIQGLRKRLRNAKLYFQFPLHNLLKTNYDFLH